MFLEIKTSLNEKCYISQYTFCLDVHFVKWQLLNNAFEPWIYMKNPDFFNRKAVFLDKKVDIYFLVSGDFSINRFWRFRNMLI